MKRPFLNARSLKIVQAFGGEIITSLKDLKAREQYVIIHRYGLSTQPPRTYREIAQDLGVSVSRAQNIERSALAKLQHLQERRTAVVLSTHE